MPAVTQNRLLGIGLRIGAATCFGFMAAMIKLGDAAGIALPELAFYRFAFGLPPLLIWIALTRNFGAWRTRAAARPSRARRARPLDDDPRLRRGHPAAARRSGDDRLRRAALLGDAFGAAARREGRPASLERGRDRLPRRADRHAAGRRRAAAARPRHRPHRRARRGRGDDRHPPDRPHRKHADHRALVHAFLDGRDRAADAGLRPLARRRRAGRSCSRSACSAAWASSS